MYGLTSVFVFRIIANNTTVKRAFYLSVSIAAVYGAAMEVVQYFLPYRSFSFGDMVANVVGAFLACILYMQWKRR
jgi:VanZ family protein